METIEYWKQRAEAAEAKLEGLRKRGADYILYQCADCDQETLNYTTHCKNCGSTDITQKELLTRPAPAADLVELVPPEMTLQDGINFVEHEGALSDAEAAMLANNACRAAILRKIEEAK